MITLTKLEYLRRQRKLTQKKLSELVGINNVTYNSIERKKLKAYPKVMQALANFFNKPVEELFDEDGEPLDVEIKL